MKRKIFSKLLMGAFLIASISMFVSCKDYDDDINDLKTQINSLKSLVDTKEATINSTISTMQSTLNTLSKLEGTLTGKISDGDAATLAAAKQAVEDAKAALSASIADGDAATLSAAKQAVADAQAKLEKAIADGDADVLAAAKQAVAEAQAALQAAITANTALIEANALAITNGDAATLEAAKKAIADAQAALDKAIADGDAAAIKAAEKAVADAQAELQKGIDANAASIVDLVAKNATQDAAITAAQTAAAQAQTQIDQLTSSLKNYASKSDLDAAKEDIAAIKTSLADMATIKTNLATVTNDLATLQTKVGAIDTDLKKAIEDITSLKTALSGQQTAITALQNKVGNLDLAKAQEDINKLLAECAEVEAALAKVNGLEAAKVAQDLASINATLTELRAAHADFATKEALSTLEGTVNGIDGAVEAIENNISAIESSINAVNSKINTIQTALAKALRSLVFQPYLYVDGIESIEYPYLVDYKMAMDPTVPAMNRQRTGLDATAASGDLFEEDYAKTIAELTVAEKTKFPKLAPLNDWNLATTAADYEEWFAPVWPVSYHMNPSKSTTAWADVIGFNRRDAEVITRSNGGASVKAAEKYVDGTNVFSNAGGILTVGIQIPDVKHLANFANPTEGTGYLANPSFDGRPGYQYEDGTAAATRQFDDIVALQVNSRTKNDADTVITSDYAMIYPEQVKIEGMIWTSSLKLNKSVGQFDEAGYPCGKNVHVWDRPIEALACAGDNNVYPDVELYYNNTTGVVLKNMLAVHVTRRSNTLKGTSTTAPATIKFTDAEFARYGLTCEFQLVGYTVDGNKTIDSNYAEFTDADGKGVSATGTIRARNVKEDGATIDTESATSVDREPLVRVFVKRGDRVLLDGYILIHITRQAPGNAADLVVDNYPEQAKEFDLCNDATVFSTNWSQFSYFVLTQKLDNMTKEAFDASYGVPFDGVPDLYGTNQHPISGATTPTTLADNSKRYDDVVLYDGKYDAKTETWGNFTKCKATDLPGYVRYYHNSVGTTNHRFEWILTANELEKLTHDAEVGNLPKKLTKFFRYTGKAGAQYPHIYVKMTFDLTRATIAESGIKEKNINYWYKYTGNDDGFDAVVWNPWFPQDGGNTKTFRQFLPTTFVGNNVNFTDSKATYADNATAAVRAGRAKFFFTPYEFEITSQKGVKYTITANPGKVGAVVDQRWNAFVCKYQWWENNGTQNVYRFDATIHNLHWYSATNDKTYTEHKWGTAAANKELHEKCAIDYNDGVYTNNTLYAVVSGNYGKVAHTPIATLNQSITSGQMDLIWRVPDNDITKEVLNAIGYEEAHANILKELHTMVGVVAHNGCFVAINITEYAKDDANTNAGTFYVSWQRPINTTTNATPMVDAKDNGDYIYTVDFLKLFDWRGPVEGKMYDEKQWLWAYYNIKSVIIDVNPANVKTNMHQSDVNKFVKLSDVTTTARLGALNTAGAVTYNGSVTIALNGGSLAAYNAASQNNALLTAMGLKPVNNAKKLAFAGGLYYENNGDNVTEFDVIVPVTVTYDWGEFISYVKVHIDRTLGN